MEVVNVGLLGLGTVGGGTVNVLTRNAKEIARRSGCEIKVIHAAARDITTARSCDVSDIQLTTIPEEVVENPDVRIIVELIGGDTLSRELVMKAIANGKHVVTANKALIAKYGNEIFSAAQKKGVMVAYEAAVAGGIPIIKAIREGLSANRIEWLAGIINGTGNFILTEMRDKGRDFADVLADAQRLGYAEADPTFDIEGVDAGHKLAILASIAFGTPLNFEKVAMEGITQVAQRDLVYAEELGYRIKHLGIAKRTGNGIEMRVHPTLIPERRLIANVDGVMNAVLVKGDAVGPTLYYGAGAGSEATASAVVADIIDVVRVINSDPASQVPYLGFQADAINAVDVLPMSEVETAYYLRMNADDKPGVLALVTEILGNSGISIEAVIQKEPKNAGSQAEIIMLTHTVKENKMVAAIGQIEALESITDKVAKIRIEPLDKD